MPNKIVNPDPDAKFAQIGDVSVYMLDLKEDFPLYRGIKLIAKSPIVGTRRTMYLTWIVHLKRLRRGGDAWRLERNRPELAAAIIKECADCFDLQYVKDTFGFEDHQLNFEIARERAKYKDDSDDGQAQVAKGLADLM